MKQPAVVYVVCDSITNSVFQGQVLQPLLKKQQENPDQAIYIISFERTTLSEEVIKQSIPVTSTIKLMLRKQLPFIGTVSIVYAAYQLKKILKTINSSYELIARGPLAGLISLRATSKDKQCISLCIQARGLLPQEYLYTHQGVHSSLRHFHRLRAWQFKVLEQEVYRNHQSSHHPVMLEAVSPELKEYLTIAYDTPREQITVAQTDIPLPIASMQKNSWFHEVRAELSIPTQSTVYCYNGSIKAWQCPEKVITFFKETLANDPASFLLVLTQEAQAFSVLLNQCNLPASSYHVMQVPHTQIYRYLAACNYGIIFREPHILNWISRPTKILEYQAAGLTIIHNNTVGMLTPLL